MEKAERTKTIKEHSEDELKPTDTMGSAASGSTHRAIDDGIFVKLKTWNLQHHQ